MTITGRRVTGTPHAPQRRRDAAPIPMGPDLPGAACAGRHAALWDDFLDRGESPQDRAARHTKAIRVCNTKCPVQEQCLTVRTTDPGLSRDWGVWGGQIFTPHGQTRREPRTPPPALTHCQWCGGALSEERRTHGARSCGVDCARKASRERLRAGPAGPRHGTCDHCSGPYTTNHPHQRFCRESCRLDAERAGKRKRAA